MRDVFRVESLLSLFTLLDRAEAIAGDLVEERRHRGSIWFWLHVLQIMLALWRRAVTDAPFAVLILAAAGCALFATPAIAGLAAVNLFPLASGSPVSWIALACFWWGGAFWTGASLVSIAPRRGMAACVTLAIVAEAALLIALGETMLSRDVLNGELLLFYAIGSVIAAPLVAGGAIAHRRWMFARDVSIPEPRG